MIAARSRPRDPENKVPAKPGTENKGPEDVAVPASPQPQKPARKPEANGSKPAKRRRADDASRLTRRRFAKLRPQTPGNGGQLSPKKTEPTAKVAPAEGNARRCRQSAPSASRRRTAEPG